MDWEKLLDRMLRAAKLDDRLYWEVENDKSAMGQAMLVVVFSGLAAGFGSITSTGFQGLLYGTISALIAWFIWSYITYFVGTRFLAESQTQADYGELLRTLGFASTPGIFRVLGIIPFVSGLIFFIISIWMLVAMVIAVKQALDFKSTWRAVGVCAIGWVIQAIIMMLFFWIFGGSGAYSEIG